MLNKTTSQSARKLPSLNKVIVSKMDTASIQNINGDIKANPFNEKGGETLTWTIPPTITFNIQ